MTNKEDTLLIIASIDFTAYSFGQVIYIISFKWFE